MSFQKDVKSEKHISIEQEITQSKPPKSDAMIVIMGLQTPKIVFVLQQLETEQN